MRGTGKQSARPIVDLAANQKHVLLQAELMQYEAQLRTFDRLRDHLEAAGQDPNAAYREIEDRRGQVTAKLKKLEPPMDRHPKVQPPAGPDDRGPLLSLPLVAANIHSTADPNPWFFGYSGSVYMGFAQEGSTVAPSGTAGSMQTFDLRPNGGINFVGHVVAAPVDGPPREYFSLHSWTYLIPFPTPSVSSTFTYSFDVMEEITVDRVRGSSVLPTAFWSFISVGETGDFTGQEVAASVPVSWPLVVDLNGVADFTTYNHQAHVQRSFVVPGGQRPAVAVVLGAVIALGSGSEVLLHEESPCYFSPGSAYGSGFQYGYVNFHYEPLPLVKGPA